MNKFISSIGLVCLLFGVANAQIISKNGIATDSVAGLIWQDETYTNSDPQSPYDSGDNKVGDAEYAKQYCENLSLGGYADWRVPNIYELLTIVDNTKSNKPYIVDGFQNSNTYFYHSSTIFAGDVNENWGVIFYFGHNNTGPKTTTGYIRCVRGKHISFDTLMQLKKKGKIKVNQGNIDKVSPSARAKDAKEAKIKQTQNQTTSTSSSRQNFSYNIGVERDTHQGYSVYKVHCSNGTENDVIFNYDKPSDWLRYVVHGTQPFKTIEEAANYICGNK